MNNAGTARTTVDLDGYPDLVVIYLGLLVRSPRGLRTARLLRAQIQRSVADKPDGLLHHDRMIYSFLPPHLVLRQYWRDFESMERWTRSMPHREWWSKYLRDPSGTAFWHETYVRGGGFEAVYDYMPERVGMAAFAPVRPARGAMFSARSRVGRGGEQPAAVVNEEDLARM